MNLTAIQQTKIHFLTSAALFSALICVMTAFLFHIPIGSNGGYVHLGDAFIYLAACILPFPYALAAGIIGGVLADLFTAPMWIPATFIIKMLIVIPFTSKKDKIIGKRNVSGIFIAGFITLIGYFIAEGILFGTWAALLPALLVGWIQPMGSGVAFLLLGFTLDHLQLKKRI